MKVAVVGSGPTGVAAASALLAHGATVELLDVGHEPEPAAADIARRLRAGNETAMLAAQLRKSGPRAQQGVVAAARMLLGRPAPPSMIEKTRFGSAFTFRNVAAGIPLDGAHVPRSLAVGGLSNVWGAACYPLRPEDYARWPLPESEMAEHYRAAATLLGLEEVQDDLATVYPLYAPPRPATPVVSRTAASLLAGWQRRSDALHRLGVHFGRARTAVRKHGEIAADAASEADLEAGRVGCQRCGLCLWGCAWDAIYRSTRTLASLRRTAGFTYRPGFRVRKVRESRDGSFVESDETAGPYAAVFLAAGALSSLRIAADTLGAHGHPRRLLDNNMYLVPSLRASAGVPGRDGGTFALSEAVLSLDGSAVGGQSMHVQLYSYGEILGNNLRGSLARLPDRVAGVPIAALERLLVAFMYLHSDDSVVAQATVVPDANGSRIQVEQRPGAQSKAILRRTLRLIRRHARAFGFLPLVQNPSGLGFSGHLCGTLPMRREPGLLETHLDGRIAGTRALYAVDAASFPVLPAQNPTYTAMANAHRIATAWAARSCGSVQAARA